jgi:hypothetical protein
VLAIDIIGIFRLFLFWGNKRGKRKRERKIAAEEIFKKPERLEGPMDPRYGPAG